MLHAAIALALWLWPRVTTAAPEASFERSVRPILERRCQPCHFAGGKMYERLPFDRAATIVKLNTRLFTRIKDEEERAVIRKFLAEKR